MRQIIYGFDRRRIATASLEARTPDLIPEVARPEETLFTLQVAPDGASVAAFYANFKDRSSSVVTYAYRPGGF